MNDTPPRESLWRRWVTKPLVQQLSQGTEPRQIALAIAFGVTTGVFPLLGTTTLLSLGVGLPLKLNQPIMQLFRELVYPVHLATILVFIHAGEWLFGVPRTPLSITLMIERFGAGPVQFLSDYGMLGVYAVCVWLLLAPLILGIAYFVSLPLVAHLSKRFSSARNAV